MGWPQYTVAVCLVLSFGAVCFLHGKPKTGNWNVLGWVIGSAISQYILYAGGFWGAH